MKKSFFLFCILFMPLLGCSEHRVAAFELDQIGAEFEKVFKNAPQDTRNLTQAIARLVDRKQYAPASLQMQTVLNDSSLSKEQRSVVARAMMSVNQAMQMQLEVQEAAVDAPPRSVGVRPGAQTVPDFGAGGAESSAAEAKAMIEHHRRTK